MTATLSLFIALLAGAWSQVEVSEPSIAPPAPPPLLVIVERGRGANASPDAIRHAIAVELGRPVIGPMDAPEGDDAEMLVVTVTADAVKMQMRSAGAGEPDRKMAALPNGEMGLKVVAWLAGNLARHQADDFVRDAPAHQRWQALEPPATALKAQAPPTSAARAEAPSAEAAGVGQPPASSEPVPVPKLRVGVLFGPTITNGAWATNGSYPNTRIEVLGAVRDRRLFWNATLDIVRYDNAYMQDFYATVGLTRRFALWRGWLDFDLTGSLGLSAFQRLVISSANGAVRPNDDTSSFTLGSAIGGATGMLAMTHWRFAELVAGATARISALNLLSQPGIVAIAGVRIGLPE